MRSARLTSLALLGGLLAGGLVLDAADDDSPATDDTPAVEAGVAMPAATPAGTLTSTWYCAGGTATDDGFADHVLLIGNPTDEAREATVTVLTGRIAPRSARRSPVGATTTTIEAPTTTEATTTTTTEPVPDPPPASVVELPAHSRVEVTLRDLVKAPLASAIVEVDGGEVAVEHQVTTLDESGVSGGRATAPCSSTASRTWSFAWGVTERGARELLVFMNPFPDDATVTIDFATDEGTRQTLRFQNFVVPGRSVVGAYVGQDVTRKTQVSARIRAGSGRVIVDRIQTFDGTNPTLEGMTLGLGAPVPAEVWAFPDGLVGEGITEKVVVFNPTEEVAEVEAEVRLADPEENGVPEPFEATIPPMRYAIIELDEPDAEDTEDTPKRIPDGVAHSILVRSLNRVPVVAERVFTRSGSTLNEGVGAVLGSPLGATTWFLVGGGVSEERSEYLTVLNAEPEVATRFTVSRLVRGRLQPIDDLEDLELAPGATRAIRLGSHVDSEVLPLVVTASGPVVAERALYRFGGRGISYAMGIPLADDVVVLEPLGT